MTRARRLTLAALLALAAVAAGGRRAAAQAPPGEGAAHVYLSWVRLSGADSCPDVRQVADDVTRRLGWNPFRETPTQFIEAQIRRQPAAEPAPGGPPGGAWVAEIFLRDASGASRGNRVFTSNAATCASLASVVALSIAIVIDPDVMLRRFSDDELFSAAAADIVPAAQRPRPPPGARGTLVMFGGAAMRLLPRTEPGLGLAGEVRLVERLTLRVGTLIVSEARTPPPDQNFAFGLSAGWLGACFDVIHREAASLGACASAFGGLLHAVVYAPEATNPGQRVMWAAMGGLRLSVRLSSRVEAQLGSDGVLPLNRRQFTVEGRAPGMDVAWSQPAAAVLFWAALGVRFR